MDTKEKIEYINKVFTRFADARNHGFNGNNWWYPKANVIAYNVKLHGMSKDIDDIRAKMSKLQNDYYSDNSIQQLIWNEREDAAEQLMYAVQEIDLVLETGFAGRSGGWLEVEFEVNFETFEAFDEDTDVEEVEEVYKKAQELEKEETEVAKLIEDRHKDYMKYLNTDEYVTDIIENMQCDNDISNNYKIQAGVLLAKAEMK